MCNAIHILYYTYLKNHIFLLHFFIVQLVVQHLNDMYVDKLLRFVARQIESSKHLHFYLLWCHHLLTYHGAKLKQR